MPKQLKSFRLSRELYGRFKEVLARSDYTVTGALEKWMLICVEKGEIVFPEGSGEFDDASSQARVLMAYSKGWMYYVDAKGRHRNVLVELLELMPKIRDEEFKRKIEEFLKTAEKRH